MRLLLSQNPAMPQSLLADRTASLTSAMATGCRTKHFKDLPVELNQEIAGYLDDKDVCAFRVSCRPAKDAIDDQDSFWFKRFHETYDATRLYDKGDPGYKKKLKLLYQKRQSCFSKGVTFNTGHSAKEKEALNMLIDLMNECFYGEVTIDAEERLTCQNLELVKIFAVYSSLLNNIFKPLGKKTQKPTSRLATVQLMCMPWCFLPWTKFDHYNFDTSQKAAYETAKNEAIFGGFNNGEVNMVWLLHLMNFFKYHIMRPEEATLYEPFHSLSSLEKPGTWQAPLKNGTKKLGKHWKGTYAYLDREEMRLIRHSNPDERSQILNDHNVDHGDRAIQTLELDFPEEPPFAWPPVFEHHLKSLTKPKQPKTRAQHRTNSTPSPPKNVDPVNFRFQATGYDDEDFLAAGWINPLPPQCGIPGWQRMTMMKYFDNGNGSWDDNALWAYEGVVLPGGQIILGRWWSPEQETPAREVYTGPFIFWNVDASFTESDDNSEAETEIASMEID